VRNFYSLLFFSSWLAKIAFFVGQKIQILELHLFWDGGSTLHKTLSLSVQKKEKCAKHAQIQNSRQSLVHTHYATMLMITGRQGEVKG
jgi:hypothetical protein